MILFTVYTQMYYTRLADCHVVRRTETDDGESSLVMRVADDEKLSKVKKHISDWAPGAYRPCVTITLRVRYAVVSAVSATAASLYKQRTCLVPAAAAAAGSK